MIRAILWKEWHEHRSKYLGYWATIHAPVILLVIALAVSSTARTPFADLSNALTMKYLPLALVQSLFIPTIFLFFTGYLAIATFSPEVEDRSLFFIFEQPIARSRYLAIKFLNGGCHVVLATACALLLMPLASYGMMLLSGKITAAGSSEAFTAVMLAAARSVVWCSLISLAGFAASTLIAALVPRWWIAALCSVALTVLFIYLLGDFFNFFPGDTGEPLSVGFGFGTGHAQWISISRALTPAELATFAAWKIWPLLIAVLIIAICCAGTAWMYERKELK